jgi:hypothetical protein
MDTVTEDTMFDFSSFNSLKFKSSKQHLSQRLEQLGYVLLFLNRGEAFWATGTTTRKDAKL